MHTVWVSYETVLHCLHLLLGGHAWQAHASHKRSKSRLSSHKRSKSRFVWQQPSPAGHGLPEADGGQT